MVRISDFNIPTDLSALSNYITYDSGIASPMANGGTLALDHIPNDDNAWIGGPAINYNGLVIGVSVSMDLEGRG